VNCEAYQSEAALAAALGRRLVDLIARRPRLVLGLPTGRTPLALYAELVRLTRKGRVDWSEVQTFNLDEFVGLGRGDTGSYHTFMRDRLFDPIGLPPSHVEFLDGRAPDLEAECERYESSLARAQGMDVLILGVGVNGHIGFNEPGDELTARTHVVTLDQRTRAANALWFGGERGRVPTRALTMGMATILSARSIVLIATGDAKSDAVRAMLEGGVTTRVPASFLQLHPQVTVMLDEMVADGLEGCRALNRR
jgi:glucosamine-6-phosphate deaminase